VVKYLIRDNYDHKINCVNLTHSCKQEQQHVAVRPGNAQFISIHQVTSDAARHEQPVHCCVPAAAAGSAVYSQFDD